MPDSILETINLVLEKHGYCHTFFKNTPENRNQVEEILKRHDVKPIMVIPPVRVGESAYYKFLLAGQGVEIELNKTGGYQS